MKYFYASFLIAACLLSFPVGAFSVTVERLDSIPLAFTLNEGQAHSSIRFTAQGSGCGMAFSPTGTTFLLSRETASSVAKRAAKRSVGFEDDHARDTPEYERFALKLAFVGANQNPEIQGEERLSWNNNYFIGNDPAKWHTDVPNYKKIRFKEVYEGIDLVYYGNQKRVKYDFVVKPGEDPDKILLKYDFGAAVGSLSVNDKGEMVVRTPVGDLIEEKPYSYQKIGGKEVEVQVGYEVVEAGTYRFQVGEYDVRCDLVIDPEMVYSTYIGGEASDSVDDIAVDSEGYAYVTGSTEKTGADSTNYPTTDGAYDRSYHTIFVSKLNHEGTAFVYSTFLGGPGPSTFPKIAVDSRGNACITGDATVGFPITENAINKQSARIFLTKLNSQGNGLISSTFWGSKDLDHSYSLSIVLDVEDNIYITGYTYSADFPTTVGSFKEIKTDRPEVFITKFNTDASKVLYSTLVGYGNATNIQVNSFGEVFISGITYGTSYPLTDNAFDKTRASSIYKKIFITKLNNTGSNLIYSTLLGGSGDHSSFGLALDSSGCAYVCGYTTSTDFPTTPGSIMTSRNFSYYCGFVSKISADGSKLEYSTLLTGEKDDTYFTDTRIRDIAISKGGYAVITGSTNSSSFPITSDAIQTDYVRGNDIILSVISKDGRALIYSTYYGGSDHDDANTLAIDTKGNVYIAGSTFSVDFPFSSGAIDTTLVLYPHISYSNGFICKFNFDRIISQVSEESDTPSAFRIVSSYPNPFNPLTTIEFLLPEPGMVKLKVYSITGQKVYEMRTGRLSAGTHQIRWQGKDTYNKAVSSGTYLIQVNNGKQSVARKVLLMK